MFHLACEPGEPWDQVQAQCWTQTRPDYHAMRSASAAPPRSHSSRAGVPDPSAGNSPDGAEHPRRSNVRRTSEIATTRHSAPGSPAARREPVDRAPTSNRIRVRADAPARETWSPPRRFLAQSVLPTNPHGPPLRDSVSKPRSPPRGIFQGPELPSRALVTFSITDHRRNPHPLPGPFLPSSPRPASQSSRDREGQNGGTVPRFSKPCLLPP